MKPEHADTVDTHGAQTRSADVPDEMVEGYLDGFNLDNPEPSTNRSASYRHGFANGRDDRAHKPRAPAADLRRMADEAIEADRASRFVL
jgi:hypothetical protein